MDDGGVEIWRIPLSGPLPDKEDREVLSAEERARADRFVFENDRRRYLISHVAVRHILAQVLGRDAAALMFQGGRNGKPELKGLPIHHNLARSDDLTLLAISPGQPVGIDVEKSKMVPEAADIAARMFSPREGATVAKAGQENRSAIFLKCWTAKEAVVKATGEGLGNGDLQSFDVQPALAGEDAIIRLPSEPRFAWVVRMVDPGEGYFAAISRRSTLGRLEIRKWTLG